ncbi:MAG: hypothetical protein WC975_13870 [Phycisphaerae bacterium]
MFLLRSKDAFDKWYLRLIAFYWAICSLWGLEYYLKQDISPTGAFIPWQFHLLCLMGAVSGFAYFVKPKLGYVGLLLSTGILLFLQRETSDSKALTFHVVVLMFLLVPLVASICQTTRLRHG